MSRPIKRRRKHAETLRTDSYEVYALLSQTIHGGENEACGVCGKPKPDGRKHDRDHDHKTGKPRGLACGGNQGCNVLMLPWVTAETARGIYEAKLSAGEMDAVRWFFIAAYLKRVSDYYAKGDEG